MVNTEVKKMKNPLSKVKTAFLSIQWNTRRKRFIGLEVLLFTSFMIGYSIIDALFLEDYATVREILDPVEYTIYLTAMMILFTIFMSMFFFGGMYFQTYLTERAMKQMMEKMKNDPASIFNEILNGKAPQGAEPHEST